MEKEELRTVLEVYIKHIIDATDYLVVYDSICDAIRERNNVVNLAPGFFNISMSACINEYLLELCKMFDNGGKQERTFGKLLRTIEQHEKLFSKKLKTEYLDNGRIVQEDEDFCVADELQRAEAFLEENRDSIGKLEGRRDRFLAHNDSKYFLDAQKLMEDFPITFEEAKKLLKYAGEFCNRMLGALCNKTILCCSENADDLKSLLDKVKLED